MLEKEMIICNPEATVTSIKLSQLPLLTVHSKLAASKINPKDCN